MTPTTVEQRYHVYFTYKRLGNIRKTAKHCGVSRKCVRKAIAHCSSGHSAIPTVRQGRKPALSATAAQAAMEMLVGNDLKTADQVAIMLRDQKHVHTVVHKATVIHHACRAAAAAGDKLVVRRGAPRRGITKATQDKRLAFAKRNVSRQCSSIMFTDRKRFLLKYPGSKVKMVRWELQGNAGHVDTGVNQPTNPWAVNIYASITRFGLTKAHIVSGTSKHKTTFCSKKGSQARNITQQEYKQVPRQTLLPEGRRLFSSA
jgi:transposase